MSGPLSLVVRGLGLATLVVMAGACNTVDTPVAAPNPDQPAISPDLSPMLVTCQGDARSGSLSCDGSQPNPTPGLSFAVLGGQGSYVQLASSNASYDATSGIFQADVTLKNLIVQPLGTPDGSTVTGVKVFFQDQPTSTGGTVSVFNPDGIGTFTQTNQPYFFYNEIVDTNLVSSARTWKFELSSGVQTFSFTVLIQADIVNESGVLRWRTMNTGTPNTLRSVFGFSGTNVFAVGNCSCAPNAVILRYNGTSWSLINNLMVHENLTGIWGTSPSNMFAVGNGSTLLHFDGTSWSQQQAPAGSVELRGVWGSSANNVFAVGRSGAIFHLEPTGWVVQASPVTTDLYAIWGTSGSNVYAVGQFGQILHYDGVAWSVVQTFGSVGSFRGIWGSSANNIFVSGSDGTIARFDGTNWTSTSNVAGVTEGLYGVSGRHASDVFVVGGKGRVLHYSATGWKAQRTGITTQLNSVYAPGETNVFAVGGDFTSSNVDGITINGTR